MSIIISFWGFIYGWFLTWFSYDFSDINIIQRIFDFLICHTLLKTKYIDIILAVKFIVCIFDNLIQENISKDNIIQKIYENKLKHINFEEVNYILRESNNFILNKSNTIESLLEHYKMNFSNLINSLKNNIYK